MDGPNPRPIVFLSDYGLEDEFVGICHAVIARVSPHIPVIDLTHSVPPHDIRAGAVLLADAVPFLPDHSVILAVVDPGVGTERRPLAVEARRGTLLVGPDNGLLSIAWAALGGPARAVEVTSREVILSPVSATFHGSDVFAPAASHLALGVGLEELGPPVDVSALTRLSSPKPDVSTGRIRAEVLGVDRFGNVQLSVRAELLRGSALEAAAEIGVGTRGRVLLVPLVRTFGDVGTGEYAALVDARGWLTIIRNGGSAAKDMGLSVGDTVELIGPVSQR